MEPLRADSSGFSVSWLSLGVAPARSSQGGALPSCRATNACVVMHDSTSRDVQRCLELNFSCKATLPK